MPAFQVLVIKEYVRGDVRQMDNKIAILYDAEEERFYYYGTRNNIGETSYDNYGGTYSYNQWKSFSLFLEFLLGKYEEVVTIETHFLDIPNNHYSILCWDYFFKHLCSKTLLAAYDLKKTSVEDIEKCLDMLVTC
jgi:hypothetical protein